MACVVRRGTGLLLALILAGFVLSPACAQILTVLHSGKWPPYSGKELPGQGLAVRLVTTALERAGYQVQVRTDSLDRILRGGKLGVYDVFATPWYSEARNQYLAFSKPYLQSYIRFIKRKDRDIHFESLDDLDGLMIGVIGGYAYDEAFNRARGIIRISERNLIQNLLKLVQGRIDLTLDDELVLRYEINRFMPNSMAELEFLPKPLAVRGIHIGVSRENPQHDKIVADFDRAIAAMKKDGSYDRILEEYRAFIARPNQGESR